MADVSISTLVQRVRDLLNDTASYQTTSTTTGVGTTVAVPDGTLWVQGDVGEWQTGTVGYEQFWVASAPVANNLTVVRGYNGTTAEAHTSGDIVVQNPLFGGRQIQQALQRAVDMLWPHVYKTTDISITPVTGQYWYDLNALTRGIVRAWQKFGTSPDLHTGVYVGYTGDRAKDKYKPLIYDEDQTTDVVASGKGVAFPGGLYHTSNTIHVRDKRIITGSTNAVAEVEAVTLEGYSGTDVFKLTWGGNESAAITRGTNNTAAGIKAAIEGITGFSGTVTVSGVTDNGFLVTWDATGTQASAPLSVTSGTGGTTGDVTVVVTGSNATTTGDIPDDGELPVAECVVYLAAARLLEGGELQRVSQGTDLEETGSVGTGSRLQTGAYFRTVAKNKLDELELRVRRKYQPLRFWR